MSDNFLSNDLNDSQGITIKLGMLSENKDKNFPQEESKNQILQSIMN